jgi:quinol monooxygenase YgiN
MSLEIELMTVREPDLRRSDRRQSEAHRTTEPTEMLVCYDNVIALVSVAAVAILTMASACTSTTSKPSPEHPLVRLAELEIDPAQLDRYKSFLQEEIESSIRIEPGVLTLYAVAVKDQPTQIRIFEMYADTAAYEAHLQTPHFLKYKTGTQGMVKSLRLLETDPISLVAKSNSWDR